MTTPLASPRAVPASAPAPSADPALDGKPRPRRHWTPEDKAEALALYAESGLPVAAFCRELGVPEATFTLWRRQAREAALLGAGDAADADAADADAADADAADAPAGAAATAALAGPASRRSRFAAVQLVAAAAAAAAAAPAAIRPGERGLGLVLRWPNGVAAELTGLDLATTSALVRELAMSWAPTDGGVSA